MIDYYAYFGFDKNTSIFEVVEKLALFLSRVSEKASKIVDVEEKNEMLNTTVKIVRDVCDMFSIAYAKESYDEYLMEQMIINSRIHKIKEDVPPLEEFYAKTKKPWLRIITCLVPHLENEKQMMFLTNEDNVLEVLTYIVENTDVYWSGKELAKSNYFIPLDIIKKSFSIAESKKRTTVKIEDIVTSIYKCEFLDKNERKNIAIEVFNRWYKTSDSKQEDIVYKKI